MLIIGGVLMAILLVGWYMLSNRQPAANTNRAANASSPARTPVVPTNAPVGATPPNMTGSATAAVTVEEFADYQCAACASANPTLNEVKTMYGSRIKFIFRNYPLSIPAHDKAYDAAVAAEAASLQGKFWDMQNQLFVNQSAWTANPNYKQLWKDYATKVGIDIPKWEGDMAGIAAKGRVDADLARGRALNVSSTPTVYVNGIPASDIRVDSLKAMIDVELAKASAAK